MSEDWQKIFTDASKLATKIRSNKPSLTRQEALKAAWKDPSIVKRKSNYDKNKAAKAKTPAKPKAKSKART